MHLANPHLANPDLANPQLANPDLTMLRGAAGQERAPDPAYTDRAGQTLHCRVWPLAMVFPGRTPLCLAWCALPQGVRRFRLHAMADVALAEWRFGPHRLPLPRQMPGETSRFAATGGGADQASQRS